MGRPEGLLQDAAALEGVDDASGVLFFPLGSQEALLHELERRVEQGQRLIVALGAQGAGKSSILYQLFQHAPTHWDRVRLDGSPMLHPEPLLDAAGRQIGIADPETATAAVICERFVGRRLKGRQPVLLVDDADQLPAASIELLLRLQGEQHQDLPCVHILLFGQPELKAKLEAASVRQALPEGAEFLQVQPLRRREADQFVESFLGADGRSGRFAMSAAQVEQVFRVSEGLPGRIEEETLQMLSEGALGYRPQFGLPAVPLSVIAAAGVLILVLIGMLLWPEAPSDSGGETADSVAPTPAPAVEEAPQAVLAPTDPDSAMEMAADTATDEAPRADIGAAWEDLPLPPLEPLAATPPQWPDSDPTPPKPAAPDAAAEPPEAPAAEPMPRPLQAPPGRPAGPAEPEGAAAEGVEPANETSAAAAPETEGPEASVAAEDPASPPVEPSSMEPRAATESPENPLRREIWALAQNPDQFTLQLVASGNQEGIDKFIQSLALPGKRALIQSRRGDRDWYTVLYGVFADRAAAVAAKAELPERHQGAWPRSFRSVREELQ